MDVLKFFRKKSLNTDIFNAVLNIVAPKLNASQYVNAYTGWVFACINAKATDIASLDFWLEKKTDKQWIKQEDHESISLLRKVNNFQTAGELLFGTEAWLEIDGNAYWYVVRSAAGTPVEIWPLESSKITIVRGDTTLIKGYVYRTDKGGEIPFEAKDIIHFRRFNPKDKVKGMGTIEAAAVAIDTDSFSAEYNKNFFFNSAQPSAVLETAQGLTDEQYARIKKAWEMNYKGKENAHKTAILEAGLQYKPTSLSQKDMDYLEGRRFGRDEILAIFRVPKSIIGIVEDVNRANAEASEYVFARRVIKPDAEFIYSRLNESYLPMFGLSSGEYRICYKNPVPENEELEIKKKESGLSRGYYTINEVRSIDGKDPVDGGDEIYIPSGYIPLSLAQEGAGAQAITITPTKGIVKKGAQKANDEILVAVRNRFIKNQIAKRRKEFMGLFTKLKDDMLEKLKNKKAITKANEDELVKLLFEDWDTWVGLLLNSTNSTLKTSLAAGGKEALGRLDVATPFDVDNSRAQDWLEENALKHATQISDTIKDEVTLRIKESLEAGNGAAGVAESIGGFFDDQSGWRALRVARSEVIAGYGQGSLEGYRQSDVVESKEWLTAGEQDDECADNEQQGAVKLDGNFVSGHDAPPAHPNCKCVLLPVVK